MKYWVLLRILGKVPPDLMRGGEISKLVIVLFGGWLPTVGLVDFVEGV
jgi:hypothetical protein